jgi:FkbM family methyltransferase
MHLWGRGGFPDVETINSVWLREVYSLVPGFRPQPTWMVADIGANLGFYSVWAIWCMEKRGVLLSFEPDPRNFPLLQRNISRAIGSSDSMEFHARQVALASEAGPRSLYTSSDCRESSLLSDHLEAAPEGVLEVDAISLGESLGSDEVDLLKIDVEGSEYDLILNSPDDAIRQAKRIVLEYDRHHPQDPTRPFGVLEVRLRQLGYRVETIHEWKLIFARRADVPEVV